ncbi:hypothetical protein Droror1_Dr00025837 [Drosera rotundifolia]
MTKGSASKASTNKEEDSIVAHEAKPLKCSVKKLKQRSPMVLAAAEKEECVNAQVKSPTKLKIKQEQGCSSKKKKRDEIDEIFSTGKGAKKVKETKKMKKRPRIATECGSSDQQAAPRRRTKDGFTIYTEEELGISRREGGDTPLCPFDCSCCF